MGGDAQRLRKQLLAWQKVTATYCQIYGFCHLRADCRGPGSALETYACFEYGTISNIHVHTHTYSVLLNCKWVRSPCDRQGK